MTVELHSAITAYGFQQSLLADPLCTPHFLLSLVPNLTSSMSLLDQTSKRHKLDLGLRASLFHRSFLPYTHAHYLSAIFPPAKTNPEWRACPQPMLVLGFMGKGFHSYHFPLARPNCTCKPDIPNSHRSILVSCTLGCGH